ncbi:MAG: hypothetical protein AAF612_06845 [Planctomycetota bacterium]
MTHGLPDVGRDAERALLEGRYAEAERLAVAAVEGVVEAGSLSALPKLLLTLQEARRQRRMDALDGGVWFGDVSGADAALAGSSPLAVALRGAGSTERLLAVLADRAAGRDVEAVVWRPADGGAVEVGVWSSAGAPPRWALVSGLRMDDVSASASASASGGGGGGGAHAWMRMQEASGDAARVEAEGAASPGARFGALWRAAWGLPSHEKLHHGLLEAARAWSREGVRS